jgi:hypothetical protein
MRSDHSNTTLQNEIQRGEQTLLLIRQGKTSGLKSQRLGSSSNGLQSHIHQETVRTASGDISGPRSEYQDASRANSNPATGLRHGGLRSRAGEGRSNTKSYHYWWASTARILRRSLPTAMLLREQSHFFLFTCVCIPLLRSRSRSRLKTWPNRAKIQSFFKS